MLKTKLSSNVRILWTMSESGVLCLTKFCNFFQTDNGQVCSVKKTGRVWTSFSCSFFFLHTTTLIFSSKYYIMNAFECRLSESGILAPFYAASIFGTTFGIGINTFAFRCGQTTSRTKSLEAYWCLCALVRVLLEHSKDYGNLLIETLLYNTTIGKILHSVALTEFNKPEFVQRCDWQQ